MDTHFSHNAIMVLLGEDGIREDGPEIFMASKLYMDTHFWLIPFDA